MNTAAVKAWEQKQSSTLQGISGRLKRQRRRRRRPGANTNCTTTDIAVETRRPQPQHISETPSHKTNNSDSPNHNGSTSSILEQTPSHSTSNIPNIVVQISQHSSFDRDLYIAYQSSLSTQGHSSSLPSHPGSGLGEPPPPSAASPSYSNGIVPDSQSFPGSSSYQPTSSVSLAVLGADQAPLTHQSRNLPKNTRGVVEAKDSIEDSSAVVVTASQPSIIASERSKSEPAPNTTLSSSALSYENRHPSLPHSTSDPTSTYHYQHRHRAVVSEQPSDHHISPDQGIQSPTDFRSPHQGEVRHTQQHQKSSEVQVPGSADRSSHQSHAVDNSPARSLVFQTQVPLAFASQGSRVSITPAGSSSDAPILESNLT